MHSSTSSSNQRLPGGPDQRVWLVALALIAVVVGSWEAYWRIAGVRPSTRDPAAYVVARARIAPNSTVLLGTSKMQSDVDPKVWARALREPAPVHLAVAGSSPLPLLEMLAADTTYRGTIVMEILPRIMFASVGGRERAVLSFEDAYREAQVSPAKWFEARLTLMVSSTFVFRRSGLRLRDAVRSLQTQRRPPVPDFRMRRDRFLPLVFASEGIRERAEGTLRRMRVAPPPAQGPMVDSIIARLDAAASVIQARGGHVAFVVLPGSGIVREFEDQNYPRERYTQVLAARTSALTIHTDDYPMLSTFPSPDGSHLAEPDTRPFTEALAVLVRDQLQTRRAASRTGD